MKNLTNNIFQLLAAILLAFSLSNCGDDEPVVPPNEEELITTVNVVFYIPNSSSPINTASAIMTFYDSDGENGPENPEVTGATLKSNTEYSVDLKVLNESVTPSENIAQEVRDESTEHQFFFQASPNLNLIHSYNDLDDDGNPIGLSNIITTGASSSGTLTLTLRHEPDKSASGVAAGDITNAGGETDIEVTFDVVIAD
jgi:hypothetical protein